LFPYAEKEEEEGGGVLVLLPRYLDGLEAYAIKYSNLRLVVELIRLFNATISIRIAAAKQR